MQTTITIRLSEDESQALEALCKSTGKSRSEIVRESLRARVVRQQLNAVRAIAVPRAQAAGWMTDEDVFSNF